MPKTAWQRHKEIVAADAARQVRHRQEQAEQCRTWEDRPLLCHLGVHRPHKVVGLSQNGQAPRQCLCCGFEWVSLEGYDA